MAAADAAGARAGSAGVRCAALRADRHPCDRLRRCRGREGPEHPRTVGDDQVRRRQERRKGRAGQVRRGRIRLARRRAWRREGRRQRHRCSHQGAPGAEIVRLPCRVALVLSLLTTACAVPRHGVQPSPFPAPGQPAARPGSEKSRKAAGQLRRDLEAVFSAPIMAHASWGVVVRSLSTGEVLYERNPTS